MADLENTNALVDVGCAYWFNDNEEVRSPFPVEIQPEVKRQAQEEFLDFLNSLAEEDAKAMTDDEMVSTFERFLFGAALKMIDKDDVDSALTLNYPFMPRVGDLVNNETKGQSRVIARSVESLEGKKPCMILELEVVDTKEAWQTEFVLPT